MCPETNEKNTLNIENLLDPYPKKTIEEDLYGFKDFVYKLKHFLENCPSPNTIGLFGPWGSGKTSLKNFLINEIEKDENSKIIPIDFISWKYENTGDIFSPLLKKLIKKTGWKKKDRLKNISSIIILAVTNIALKKLTGNMFGLEDIKSINKVKKNFGNYSNIFEQLEKSGEEFQRLIKEIIENENKKTKDKSIKDRVIIFIDELDRCSPENSIKLLESVKNYLESEGCIFVILADDEIIASYINKKYEGTSINGFKYLEKIINFKFRIPETPEQIFHEFILKIQSLWNFNLNLNKFTLENKIKNPRIICRVINKYKLYYERKNEIEKYSRHEEITKLEETTRDSLFLLIIAIHELYPKIYNNLNTWDAGRINKVKDIINEVVNRNNITLIKDSMEIFGNKYTLEELSIMNNILSRIFNPPPMFSLMNNTLKDCQII
ncbi:MAG: KAP family P-loop NTPase fold protein [Promethearchaeota archaeon]